MNDIIGFAGKMRSGKGMAASYLHNHFGYEVVAFADKLKEICVPLIGVDSVDVLDSMKNNNTKINLIIDEEFCEKVSYLTEVPAEYIKEVILSKTINTVRELLQILGTDVLRGYNENWHVHKTIEKIIELRKSNKKVVIGDVRFKNEKLALESIGGSVYYIDKTFEINTDEHISENSLSVNDFGFQKNVILNNTPGNINLFLYNVKKTVSTQKD